MKKIRRTMTNICSEDLPGSKAFYTKLFDLRVDYDSDWFVHLVSEEGDFELGIIDSASELVPKSFQGKPGGFYMTFVVDDVDAVFETVKAENLKVVAAPEDTFYGQRRLLLQDPNGTLVDVSSPIIGFEVE